MQLYPRHPARVDISRERVPLGSGQSVFRDPIAHVSIG
jgi:hypothetical protein